MGALVSPRIACSSPTNQNDGMNAGGVAESNGGARKKSPSSPNSTRICSNPETRRKIRHGSTCAITPCNAIVALNVKTPAAPSTSHHVAKRAIASKNPVESANGKLRPVPTLSARITATRTVAIAANRAAIIVFIRTGSSPSTRQSRRSGKTLFHVSTAHNPESAIVAESKNSSSPHENRTSLSWAIPEVR